MGGEGKIADCLTNTNHHHFHLIEQQDKVIKDRSNKFFTKMVKGKCSFTPQCEVYSLLSKVFNRLIVSCVDNDGIELE